MKHQSSQHINPTFAAIERNGSTFVLSVGTGDQLDRNAGSVQLTREELRELIEDAQSQLDRPEIREEQSELLHSVMNYAHQQHRLKALEMARSTPGLNGHEEVLKAAAVYYAYIVEGSDPRLNMGAGLIGT